MDQLFPEQYTFEEQAVIKGVEKGLKSVDHTQDHMLLQAFEDIIKIFENTRNSINSAVHKSIFKEANIEIDLTLPEPELRFYITEKPWHQKSRIGRALSSILPGKSKTKILVLTKNGYRTATPNTLASNRYRSSRRQIAQIANYGPNSANNIYNFINEVRQVLIEAHNLEEATDQTPLA